MAVQYVQGAPLDEPPQDDNQAGQPLPPGGRVHVTSHTMENILPLWAADTPSLMHTQQTYQDMRM